MNLLLVSTCRCGAVLAVQTKYATDGQAAFREWLADHQACRRVQLPKPDVVERPK